MAGLYVSKITKAGQVSIPKELREGMRLGEAEYVSMEPRGSSILMRKVKPVDEVFDYFQEEAGKRGVARSDVQKAIDEVRSELMKERYGIG